MPTPQDLPMFWVALGLLWVALDVLWVALGLLWVVSLGCFGMQGFEAHRV